MWSLYTGFTVSTFNNEHNQSLKVPNGSQMNDSQNDSTKSNSIKQPTYAKGASHFGGIYKGGSS